MDNDKCDIEVYQKGQVVAVTAGSKTDNNNLLEGLVPFLADGVLLDWHYVAGRTVWKILKN